MTEEIMTRLAILLSGWTLGLLLFNPFLEGPKRRVAAVGCAIVATVCFAFAPLFA